MSLMQSVKDKIKGELLHRQNINVAYTSARREADIRYQPERAERDAKERYLPPRQRGEKSGLAGMGQRMIDVMGGGSGGGGRGGRSKASGGLGGLAAFERQQMGGGRGGSGGGSSLASFEKRSMAAVEGRSYREPKRHGLHHKRQPNIISVGGKKYYRGR